MPTIAQPQGVYTWRARLGAMATPLLWELAEAVGTTAVGKSADTLREDILQVMARCWRRSTQREHRHLRRMFWRQSAMLDFVSAKVCPTTCHPATNNNKPTPSKNQEPTRKPSQHTTPPRLFDKVSSIYRVVRCSEAQNAWTEVLAGASTLNDVMGRYWDKEDDGCWSQDEEVWDDALWDECETSNEHSDNELMSDVENLQKTLLHRDQVLETMHYQVPPKQ